MFRKKDEEQLPSGSSAPRDETAYEDNWYRSLKALSERQDHEPSELEDETPVETAVEDETPVPTIEPDDDAQPEELEARAEHLLERLRSLQHLGDEAEETPEPKAKARRVKT